MAYNFNLPEGPELEAERARMRGDYTLKYDERGRPYFERPGGEREYVSPVSMGGTAPEDETGIFRSRPQWNPRTGEWETPIDWGNILTTGTAAAMTGGLAHAIMAGGAPAVAGSGAASSAAPSGIIGGGMTSGSTAGAGGLFAPTGLVGTGAATAGGTGAALGGTAATVGGGSVLSRILGGAKSIFGGGSTGDTIRSILGGAGRGIEGATQASATNRGVALEAELEAQLLRQQQKDDYEKHLIQRSQDDRESLGDAWLRSNQAQRVLNNKGYTPAMISQTPGSPASSLPMFDLGAGTRAPTDGQRSDAMALYDEVQPRLYGGSRLPPLAEPIPYQNDPKYMEPGAGERIGNWLGPAFSAFGSFAQRARPAQPPRTT